MSGSARETSRFDGNGAELRVKEIGACLDPRQGQAEGRSVGRARREMRRMPRAAGRRAAAAEMEFTWKSTRHVLDGWRLMMSGS